MDKKYGRRGRRLIAFAGVILLVLMAYRLWMYAESSLFFRRMRESAEPYAAVSDVMPRREKERSAKTGMTDQDSRGLSDWPVDALRIDWDALRGTDTVAWLRIGTISYPVMQAADNSYYLHRLPDGRANAGGSLFLQAENNACFLDRNSIIYGHNMANGSMFGRLKQIREKTWKKQYFDLYLPDGSLHRYGLFSVLRVPAGSDAFAIGFPDMEDYAGWQRQMKAASVRSCTGKISKKRRMVTLVTCDGPAGTGQRLAVMGIERRVWRQPAGKGADDAGQEAGGRDNRKTEGEGA